MIVNITVDVVCRQNSSNSPAYRIFVDSDLLVERSFIWGNQSKVSESIIVELEVGEHTLSVSSVDHRDVFKLLNIKVNNVNSYRQFKI